MNARKQLEKDFKASEGTQGAVGVLDIAEHIIDELEELMYRTVGDENFDAGWKAGLEKAIEMIREKKNELTERDKRNPI